LLNHRTILNKNNTKGYKLKGEYYLIEVVTNVTKRKEVFKNSEWDKIISILMGKIS